MCQNPAFGWHQPAGLQGASINQSLPIDAIREEYAAEDGAASHPKVAHDHSVSLRRVTTPNGARMLMRVALGLPYA